MSQNENNIEQLESEMEYLILNNQNQKSVAIRFEELRVNWICEQINYNQPLGLIMKQKYFETVGKEILKVEQAGGRRNHYDILIWNTDGTQFQCEEKGTQTYHPNINQLTKPWEHSVQFYNGPCNNFSISRKYLRIWYDINVDNLIFNQRYQLPNIPEFEDWLKGSPHSMVDPKIEYSNILKQLYKERNGGNSMNGTGSSNHDIDYRVRVNAEFMEQITNDDKEILIGEVQEIYNSVMREKNVWLQTTGIPSQQLSFQWYNGFEPAQIVSVEVINAKDIKFKFNLNNGNSFNGIMRWGKGCGFSCFRMDLK
jgi:hypothetical protein